MNANRGAAGARMRSTRTINGIVAAGTSQHAMSNGGSFSSPAPGRPQCAARALNVQMQLFTAVYHTGAGRPLLRCGRHRLGRQPPTTASAVLGLHSQRVRGSIETRSKVR